MSKGNIVRAWKDDEYRETLSASEQASLPANPAGLVGLTDEELMEVQGGCSFTLSCPTARLVCGTRRRPHCP